MEERRPGEVIPRKRMFRLDMDSLDKDGWDKILAEDVRSTDGRREGDHTFPSQAVSHALYECSRIAPQKPRNKDAEEWDDIGHMVRARNACRDAVERRTLTREVTRRRRALKRKRAREFMRRGRPPIQSIRKHTPLVDEEGNPLVGLAPTMRMIHDHFESKYGGGAESARAALHAAVSETRATARDGHGGSPWASPGRIS